jgi:hypothetical protein
MTYVDADWSDGEFYSRMGFECIEKIPPLEFWLDRSTGIREYPHLVLKKYDLTIETFSSESDKNSFLKNNGYTRVFNSGSYKFLLQLK